MDGEFDCFARYMGFKRGSRKKQNSAESVIRWPKCRLCERPKQMRYFYHSLERFDMMETLETFDLVLLFQIVMEMMRSRRSMMSTSRERRLKSAIVFAMVVLTIGYFEDDINRRR